MKRGRSRPEPSAPGAAARRGGRLAGRVALVTGAGRGIGRGIALAFAREGARVVVLGRRQAPLDAVVRAVTRAGGEALAVRGDIARPDDATRAVEAALARWRRLDVLVNNAAIYEPASLAETSLAAWERTLSVNLTGAFLLTREALPALARRGGSVINVSSTIGLRPVSGSAAYCVSKAALDMLTRVTALEGAPRRVRANSILLGIVDTPIHAARGHASLTAWKRQAAALHPLGRMGRPADAAAAAVYLASDEAAWTTGALLVVDGGIALV